MSLDWIDDENIKLIIDLFMDYPGSLGKRETWRLLKGQMARNTIDEKMAFLIERGFMQVEPDDKSWRQGQPRRYFLTESVDMYIEFLERIFIETEKYIFTLNKYTESSKEIEPTLEVLIKYSYKAYNLSHLMDVICTWNYEWMNNMELMSEILNVWFLSYRKIEAIISKIMLRNIDKVNRDTREIRKSIEKSHSIEVDILDKVDTEYLNFYRKPKQKLDVVYQDIEVNNDDDKKS